MKTPLQTSLAGVISGLLGSLHESTGAIEAQIEVMQETVGADACVILEIDTLKGTVHILGGSGLHTPAHEWQMPPDMPQLVEHIINLPDARAITVKEVLKDDPFLEREAALSILVLPTIVGHAQVAIAAIFRDPKDLHPDDVDGFAAIAGVISMAEHFRILLKERTPGKDKDQLTGLGLFSDFHESMGKELARARRGGGSVTMGIMAVVSTQPDTTGDALLGVARVFKDKLRNFDTLDRYGSTELAFILPELRSAEGVRVLERVVREIVSSLEEAGSAPDIYVGLSCYPEDGATAERLIEMAEAAMNQAVEAGVPGVYRWEE